MLRVHNAPLILSFLGRRFIDDNRGAVPLGELVSALDDELFAIRRATSSDQGRSFQAFCDFLLSEGRQDELSDLLDAVQNLPQLHADGRVVDTARLAGNIRAVVPPRAIVALDEIVALYPIHDGAAEILGYLSLDDDELMVVVDETGGETTIDYTDSAGTPRRVRMPLVKVTRR